MSGRAATINVIPGEYALSVGLADMPTPPGWAWAELGAIARLESGHTPSREHPEYWDGGIGWIGIKDARLHHGGIIHETSQTVTEDGLANSAARLLPPGTVCLSRTASVGYVVVMGTEMATSQDFVNWVCGPALDPHFLKYLFIAENRSLFRFGKGSTHTTIYFPEVKAFHICLPPLAEQKRIVAKIEELTARSRRAKEALDAVPPLLDQLRQSILAAAFRGDLTADWRAKNPNVEPADQLLARIRTERRASRKSTAKQETSPEVTALVAPHLETARSLGWQWSPLEDLCDSGRPITYGIVQTGEHTDGGIPTVRCGDIKGYCVEPASLKLVEQQIEQQYPRTRLRGGEVLVAIRGTVGGVAVAGAELAGANISREVAMLAVLPGVNPHFLALALASPLGRALLSLHTKGVAQSGVNIADLRAFPLLVPPHDEQVAIVARVHAAFARLEQVNLQAQQSRGFLENLDQSILAKAFRGELVPQDPNDEPASVLLKRIRAARAEASAAPRRRGRAGSSAASEEDEGRRSQAPAARPAETGAAVDAPRRRGRPPKAAPRAPEPEPESSPAPSRRAHARAPDSESPPAPARRPPPPTAEPAPAPDSPPARRPGSPAADLTALDPDALRDHVFAALWTHGPLDKDAAVRRLADHLRQAGLVDYQRLRADGPLYTALLATIESAAKAGTLDRPGRGIVRASKPDPTTYTIDDWRHALLATLPQTPTDREEAIRAAAEWSRHHLGLQFTRLRADGHIITGLRSALNSAIRRHEITRHGPTLISRPHNPTQLPLTLDPPTPRRP